MNKSIQTLLAILLLVVGTSATGPYGASQPLVDEDTDKAVVPDQPIKTFVPDGKARKKCFDFVRNNVGTVSLPDDIAQLMDEIQEKIEKQSNAILAYWVRHRLQDWVMPTSCPQFAERIDKIENDEDHCGWLKQRPDIAKQIHNRLIMDYRISPIILAAEACATLQQLKALKETYQNWYEDLREAYKEITVPEDVEHLMGELNAMGGVSFVTMRDKDLPSSCPELSKKEKAVRDHLNNLRSQAKEQYLFFKIIDGQLKEDAEILKMVESAHMCEALEKIRNDLDSESFEDVHDPST